MNKDQFIFGGLGFSGLLLGAYYMDISVQDQVFWYVLVPLAIAVGILTGMLRNN